MKKIVLLGLLFFCLFFYRKIFLGEVLYCCDNFLITIPSKVFLIEQLRQGIFPLWNPYIFSSTPFFADLNLALLYPLNVLYAVLSPFQALTWGILLNVLIALTGTYVFARSLKLSRLGSFVSALVFGFSGTMMVYTNNAPMIQVASLLPWIVWSVGRYLDQPKGITLVTAVLLTSIQILAGHPQLTFYTWLFVFVYAFWQYGWRKTMQLFPLGVLIFLLTAVQTFPFLEFVRHSTRPQGDYTYATFDSLNPLSIVRLLFPFLIGNLSRGYALAFGGSMYGYVGIIALILVLFAKRKDRTVQFFLLSAAASFLLALGKFTPVFWLAYLFIPGIGSFRSPQHFLLLYTMSIAMLAGAGVQRFGRMRLLLIVVIFLELFIFSRYNLLTVPESQTQRWMAVATNTAEQFGQLDEFSEKILVDQNLFPNPNARGWPFIDMAGETAWQATILRPNLNMLYHLPSIDGYASLVLRTYQKDIAPQTTDPTGVDLRNISSDLLKKLGVRFFLTKGIDTITHVEELSGWQPQGPPSMPVPTSVRYGMFLSLIGLVVTTVTGFTWKGEKRRVTKH